MPRLNRSILKFFRWPYVPAGLKTTMNCEVAVRVASSTRSKVRRSAVKDKYKNHIYRPKWAIQNTIKTMIVDGRYARRGAHNLHHSNRGTANVPGAPTRSGGARKKRRQGEHMPYLDRPRGPIVQGTVPVLQSGIWPKGRLV